MGDVRLKHSEDRVEELSCCVRAIVLGDPVKHAVRLFCPDRRLVYDAAHELSILYDDVLALALCGLVPFRCDDKVKVLWQEQREELPACVELLAVLCYCRLWQRPFVAAYHRKVCKLVLCQRGPVAGQHERAGDKISDGAYDGPTVPWRYQLVLHPHEKGGFGPCLFTLRHVKVHFVPVKVGVVGRADCRMQAERPVGEHPDAVRHDRHPVQ